MKGNLLLGSATGKLGSVVLYRSLGEQRARIKATSVANPRANGQMVTRVILSTTAKAYSELRGVCDHSFQGISTGFDNQREFMRRNCALLRNIFLYGGDVSAQYSPKGAWYITPNTYIVSSGSLESYNVDALTELSVSLDLVASTDKQQLTWREFAIAAGVPVGCQLTFVGIYKGTDNQPHVEVRRLILRDEDGAVDTNMFENQLPAVPAANTNVGLHNAVRDSVQALLCSQAGEGLRKISIPLTERHNDIPAIAGTIYDFGVIVSNFEDGAWKRSYCRLKELANYTATMQDAIESYSTPAVSDRYLNEKGVNIVPIPVEP